MFAKRNVDDLMLDLSAHKIVSALNVFNQFNEHLQFTCKEEESRSLPFHDLLVMRCQNNVVDTENLLIVIGLSVTILFTYLELSTI